MKKNSVKSFFKSDNALLIVLIVICVIIFSAIKSSFLSFDSFESIAKQLPEIGLFTFAMMIPMLVGGIDLSIISSANLSAILMTMYMNANSVDGTYSAMTMIIGLIICMAVCILVGFLNGVIIAKFKIPAMLVTLGMQMALTGIALGITKGGTLSGYSPAFKFIGNGMVGPVPMQFILFIIAALVLIVVMQKTSFGIKLQMYGSNSVATQYSGIREMGLLIKTHMLSGVFVGLAAIIMTSRLTSASAGTAGNYLMRTILIAVLGGVDPNGGKGRVSGVLWAVILFQIVATGLNILKVNAYIVIALYGVILLLAVLLRTRRTK
ncbi:MAG: ABC transporter permease [Lachnospiraceae bacterium]|nr:ABC transporter permease [Lachnospiraceae bacterium]